MNIGVWICEGSDTDLFITTSRTSYVGKNFISPAIANYIVFYVAQTIIKLTLLY